MADNSDCECACHGLNREYRLMRGTSYEGVSIREVLTDDKGNVVDWSEEPIFVLAPTKKEAKEDLGLVLEDVKDMFTAFNKPVLDESELEGTVRAHGT